MKFNKCSCKEAGLVCARGGGGELRLKSLFGAARHFKAIYGFAAFVWMAFTRNMWSGKEKAVL